jgi:hypothetical protein
MASDEQSHIVEWPFTQGQNEGTERAVLPVGQFSYVQNARYRKLQRLGKRFGYSKRTSLDANGVALGNGNGRINCLGPLFCAVDDVFYRRNEFNGTWSVEPSGQDVQDECAIWNRFPEVMPAPIIDPPVQDHPANGNAAPYSGMTTGLGLIWTAEARIFDVAWYVFISAVDPDTSTVVFTQELSLFGTAATSDTPGVQLLSTDSTIMLMVDEFTAGVKSAVRIYSLTTLIAGFGTGTSIPCIQSAANYYPTSANLLLFAYVLTASPTVFRVGTLDPSTGAVVQLSGVASVGNKTRLSIFGRSAGGVCCSFFDATDQQVQVLDAAFVQTGFFAVTATVVTAVGPVMFAERLSAPTYTLVAIFKDVIAAGPTVDVCAFDFSELGVVPASAPRQRNSEAISQPFTVSSTVDEVYIWLRGTATDALGVATLVRVPHQTEWEVPSSAGVFPAQATVDDRDVPAPLAARSAGPPFPTPRQMSNGYNALLNYTRSSFVAGATAQLVRSVALVPVRHLTEGPRYAMSCVVPVIDRQFVAGGQPQWVSNGALSAQEAGFIQQPLSIAAPVESTTGGGLTLLATYSYTVVFESSVGGVTERSAPAVPVTITLTGGNETVTTRWIVAEMSARRQVSGKIYRTAANGSVFYFVNKFDAKPDDFRWFSFVDVRADSDIIQNEALYINIGQEVAASNVPACSFANTGGNRLWCGGGFSGNIVQASKQFAPHLAPEFADDDAWRVTLPANCTGAAWCDSEVLFTQEGIYIVNGDGPDVAGVGFFTTTRLPFNIGCIDWRSVVTCDLGVMFQSARGLYLLPRGFGTPVAMDQVLDTLTTYPIITSARSDYNSTGGADNSEQIVQWTAVADEAATSGVVITFDLAYKAFYVDTFGADYPAVFQSGWAGDAVQAPALATVGSGGASKWHPFRVWDTNAYSDEGLPIEFKTVTGDVRPWGTFGHGVVERLGFLGEMRSACTVNVTKTTDKGTRAADPRVYTAAAPDPLVGQSFYLAVDLGQPEQKDVTTLRTEVSESSTLEGVTLSAMVTELGNNPQNFKLLRIADRIG